MDKEKTLFENLKDLEERKKKWVMGKILTRIKKDAQEVLKLKEKFDFLMEELKIDKKEAKQIIDWINSLVQLTESEKENLKKEAKNLIEDEQKEVEKKIKKQDFPTNLYYSNSSTSLTPAIGTWGTTLTAANGTNYINCANSSNEIQVQ